VPRVQKLAQTPMRFNALGRVKIAFPIQNPALTLEAVDARPAPSGTHGTATNQSEDGSGLGGMGAGGKIGAGSRGESVYPL
jgi:hypothetical protein